MLCYVHNYGFTTYIACYPVLVYMLMFCVEIFRDARFISLFTSILVLKNVQFTCNGDFMCVRYNNIIMCCKYTNIIIGINWCHLSSIYIYIYIQLLKCKFMYNIRLNIKWYKLFYIMSQANCRPDYHITIVYCGDCHISQ